MTLMEILPWLIGINGACLAGITLYKTWHHAWHGLYMGIDNSGHGPQKMAYALSYTLMLVLIVVVAIWDQGHPGEQFPLVVRMWFTVPAILLGDIAFIKWAREWDRAS